MKNRSVRPVQLENPERDLDLANREEAPHRQEREPKAAEDLRVLRERLKAARELQDTQQRHCRDCFQRGRDAVLRFLEGT